VATDWLAAGIDPERSTVFIQSLVPQHAELHLLLSMIVPVPWLERVPTYKEQQQNLSGKDLSTYGFLGYPLLQTADIIVYKADAVPVGEDQAPHIELTREVVRRFNNFYGPVFPEPKTLLTAAPRTPGTDGRKMSKSYQNTIDLRDSPETVRAKLKPMLTDPARQRRSDPGTPEKCPVYDLHKAFSPPEPRPGPRRLRRHWLSRRRRSRRRMLEAGGVRAAARVREPSGHGVGRIEKLSEKARAQKPGDKAWRKYARR
jgi:tryptophanyl-tRNA synthetase